MSTRSDSTRDLERPLSVRGPMLGVWAHPDDETYLSAGLMAQAVRQGDRCVCITATRGEAGSLDEERWPTATLGQVRERELERSMEILGVTDHRWLDYKDGACDEVDPAEGVGRVRQVIEEVRPHSVFTFGPDGMTGHPDHKAVSAWTTEAFRLAAASGARLYYATTTPEWVAEFAPRFDRFNVFMEPGTPPVTTRDQLAIDFDLPDDLLDLKVQAFEAHESQLEGMLHAFGRDFFRQGYRSEFFVLAAER